MVKEEQGNSNIGTHAGLYLSHFKLFMELHYINYIIASITIEKTDKTSLDLAIAKLYTMFIFLQIELSCSYIMMRIQSRACPEYRDEDPDPVGSVAFWPAGTGSGTFFLGSGSGSYL